MLNFYSKTRDTYYIEYMQFDENYEMRDLHYHLSYELYFLEEGTRTYIIDGNFYEVKPNDVILIPPMSLHRTSGAEFKRYLINFSDIFINTYFTPKAKEKFMSCFNTQIMHLSDETAKEVKKYLAQAIESFNNHEGNEYLYTANILYILSKYAKKDCKTEEKMSDINKTVSDIIKYIHNNYKKIESISQIADMHFITKYHLCRVFKKATGISLMQYINSVKIHASCRMLDTTNKNVSEISYDTGFNSSMYFCKTFKKLMGMTPSEYRARMFKQQ